MDAVHRHQQRLEQHTEGQEEEPHQPNAGDGRVFGSPDSKEPEPRLLDNGEPIPFDEAAAAKHAQRLEQHTKQRQSHADESHGNESHGNASHDDEQHQPRVGDGRKMGSPDSQEPKPEQLDNGEPLPTDTAAVAKHQQRLEQQSQQQSKQHQSHGDDEPHQPRVGDGRKLGSSDSQEPQPEQVDTGGALPLDLDAIDKHQQRLEDEVQEDQHQPRVGDGRVMGSPESKEPEPVVLEGSESLPVDEDSVSKHQKRLEQKAAQRSARHENAHSDEFAVSGDQEPDSGTQKDGRGDTDSGKEGGKDGKPVYVDAAPLAALFQVLKSLPNVAQAADTHWVLQTLQAEFCFRISKAR